MNICVYGAASQQIHTDFLQGAHQLGHCLAKAGFGLVFGGCLLYTSDAADE